MKILEVGPIEERASRKGPLSIERRTLDDIEGFFRRRGQSFTFLEQFQILDRAFPGNFPLRVLDSGCGGGYCAPGFHEIGRQIGREVIYTGVTLTRPHAPYAQANGVDNLVLGSTENFYNKANCAGEQYQFVIDYAGAITWADNPLRVMRIYPKVLVRRGRGLIIVDPELKDSVTNRLAILETLENGQCLLVEQQGDPRPAAVPNGIFREYP